MLISREMMVFEDGWFPSPRGNWQPSKGVQESSPSRAGGITRSYWVREKVRSQTVQFYSYKANNLHMQTHLFIHGWRYMVYTLRGAWYTCLEVRGMAGHGGGCWQGPPEWAR